RSTRRSWACSRPPTAASMGKRRANHTKKPKIAATSWHPQWEVRAMVSLLRNWFAMPVLLAGAAAVVVVSGTYTSQRDGIGELRKRTDAGIQTAQIKDGTAVPAPAPQAAPDTPASADAKDAEASSEQAQRLMKAVDAILQDAARNRGEARKLPSENDYIVRPI